MQPQEVIASGPEIPNGRLIDFADSPAVLRYDPSGAAPLRLDLESGSELLDITAFRRVSILVGETKASSCELHMGKIGGATLAQRYTVPLDSHIHTFDVVGPEIRILFKGGAANSTENVPLWLYLTS